MTFKKAHIILATLVIASLSLQCKGKAKEGKKMATPTPAAAAQTTDSKWQAPAAPDVDPARKYFAVIKTSKGDVKIELFSKEAPLSVTNFSQLAKKGFYKNLTFHRVVPGFVVQGGDPTGTGTGGPGYTIPAEIKLPHKEGSLAWARLPEAGPMGQPINPEKRSSGSQFYICLAPQPSLDGGYTVFGQVTAGMDVVQKIQRGDTIQDIEIQVE